MKKFTLLALSALTFGIAAGQNVLEIKNSPTNADPKDRVYYRVKNMRAMRMNYSNGILYNKYGDSINVDKGGGSLMDSVMYTKNDDGTITTSRVPMTSDNGGEKAYMGLSSLGGNWWLSFSAENDIKDTNTEFWYFEDYSNGGMYPGGRLMYNAVIKGTVSGVHKSVRGLDGYSRMNMDFNSNKRNNRYWILPVRPAFEKMGQEWVDSILGVEDKPGSGSLTEELFNAAFALCTDDSITIKNQPIDGEGGTVNNDGNCLDMNNYINVKRTAPKLYLEADDEHEVGDTIKNANGNVQNFHYGFAGVDRTWSPITTTSNKNHWMNNGCMFFFEEADAADAVRAIAAYEEVIKQGFVDGANENAKLQFANAKATITGWLNLDAIWAPDVQQKLNDILTYCTNWNGGGTDVSIESVEDPDTRDAYVASVKKLADQKLVEAAHLVGEGCKIRIQNMLAFRDHKALFNADDLDIEEFCIGNAYLTAGGDITYRFNGHTYKIENPAVAGLGLVPSFDDVAEETLWTLIPVANKPTFLLYNEKTGLYIRRYQAPRAFVGEDYLEEGADEISWQLTKSKSDAAPFLFQGSESEEDTYFTSEGYLTSEYHDYLDALPEELQTVQNKARLHAEWTNVTLDDDNNEIRTDMSADIHRASTNSDYKFVNYTPHHYSFIADSNTFLIHNVERGTQGSINEISAENQAKQTGIYDLQGRKFAKAGKGLYIVNGQKMLIK